MHSTKYHSKINLKAKAIIQRTQRVEKGCLFITKQIKRHVQLIISKQARSRFAKK